MDKLFVIDASGYLYSSYFAIRNMTNSRGESTNALFGFIRSVQKLVKDFQPEYMMAVFDGPQNGKAREEIFPEYKAHRKETPGDLPPQINWAHDYCQHMGIPFLNIPEVEADDVMGSIAVWAAKHGFETYLCTSDKDMCQLVTDNIFILNTRKDNLVIDKKQVEEIHGVPPEKMIDLLALIGDTSDNVPGVPGIGPKTAVQLLQQFGSLDGLLQQTDKVEGKKRSSIESNRDKAELSRQLVTINTQVKIPYEASGYHLSHPRIDQLKEFYSYMSFNSLLKDLDSLGGEPKKKPPR